MPATGEPNLAEAQIRAEIEGEVRDEWAQRFDQEENALRDRRFVALCISVSVGLLVGIPLLGFAAGLGVRVFRLVSGL